MTRYVIHNHLPAKRVTDAEPSKSDPKYKEWEQRQREEQNSRGGSFHDARDAELNYSHVMKGWMFRHGGKNYGPFKNENEAQSKLSGLKGSKDRRDFRGVVNRDDEERNRDRMYRDAGITRV